MPGWQVSGATSRRFFFTETSKSYAKWLGDTANVGTIEAVFYREKRARSPASAPRRDEGRPAARESPGGRLAAGDGGARRKGVATDRRDRPRRRAEADAFAATGIGDATEFPVQWVAFEAESSPAARIALRYEFRTELVRLGVLPREDELYARDRARGFEHEYAPDPYRR